MTFRPQDLQPKIKKKLYNKSIEEEKYALKSIWIWAKQDAINKSPRVPTNRPDCLLYRKNKPHKQLSTGLLTGPGESHTKIHRAALIPGVTRQQYLY